MMMMTRLEPEPDPQSKRYPWTIASRHSPSLRTVNTFSHLTNAPQSEDKPHLHELKIGTALQISDTVPNPFWHGSPHLHDKKKKIFLLLGRFIGTPFFLLFSGRDI